MCHPRPTTHPPFATEWSSLGENSSMFTVSQPLLGPHTDLDLGGRTLKVVTALFDPFTIRHQKEGVTWYTGLCIDLLDILSSALNFTYTITESPDQIWGQQTNGTWMGMTGMLHRKEVDMAVAGMSVAADRATVSDYTTGFFYDQTVMVTKRPDPVPVGGAFFTRPFHWLLYVLLGCGLLLTTAVWACLERCHVRMHLSSAGSEVRKTGPVISTPVVDMVFTLLGAMVARAIVYQAVSNSSRVLLASCLLVSMVTVATYTGKLAANAVLTKQSLPFKSLSELVARDDYVWGLVSGTLVESVFSNSSLPNYQKYYQKTMQFAEDDPDVLSNDFDHVTLKKLLEGNYVHICSYTYYKVQARRHCQLDVVREKIFQDTYAIHLQKGSPYTHIVDQVLLRMKEAGLLDYLTRKWMPETASCHGDETHVQSVSVQLVHSAFIMAAVGVALAAILLILECLFCRFHFSTCTTVRLNG